jgi:hypothetical protein
MAMPPCNRPVEKKEFRWFRKYNIRTK